MQFLTDNQIRTKIDVTAEWDAGFTIRLDLTNLGDTLTDGIVEFESQFEIIPGDIWGAEIVSRVGDTYTLKLADDRSTIDSQQSSSVFFNANKINSEIVLPQNIKLGRDSIVENYTAELTNTDVVNTAELAIAETILSDVTPASTDSSTVNIEPATASQNSLAADVDFSLIQDWGSGFQGAISITNNTGGNIDSWNLEFDFPNEINNIWDAEIEENKNGNYVVSNAAWNREIGAGETLTFGFTGNDSVSIEPQNFELFGSSFKSPSTSDSIYSFSNPDLIAELELDRPYQGRATFFDAANPAGGLGNSGFDIPTSDQLHKVVAINNIQWNGSEASGAFLTVSGPKQREGAAPIMVQVTDQLWERADGLDMSAEAFAKVADPVDGIVNIDYQLVGPADDYVTAYGHRIGDGIVVETIDGTNPYYAATRLNNHRYPIESVELIEPDGDLVELNRESDNRFVMTGNYPLNGVQDLLVTDIFGQQVTLDDINITSSSAPDAITGEQFAMI
ncbi:MAG: expansin EXLX1 family cellulose-binding protein [Cyanobacteria bacterium J06621_12]